VIQRLLSLALLLGVILWLVLIYAPDSLLPLPILGYPSSGRLLASLAVSCLAAFLAVQGVVLRSTAHSIQPDRQTQTGHPPFRLHRPLELVWTALPLLMTLALAWASYPLWRQLLHP
jgi:heme/copper-type cytochrome/quinol oxidase subunit 2